MGRFYNAAINTTDPTARATSISEWFNNLDGVSSELIDYTYSGDTYKSANITIDGTDIEMLFGIKSNSVATSVSHAYNGETALISDYYRTAYDAAILPAKLYAYIDDNCILLSAFQSNSYNPADSGIAVVYLKTTDNKHLVGYITLSNDTTGRQVEFADMSLLTFEDVDDTARVPYKYTNMFPYVAVAGTIDFITKGFFVNANQYKHFETEALRECSTVTLLSSQSLPTGNCVALGAHCLAPVDEEEG